jgi:hypothetical protein
VISAQKRCHVDHAEWLADKLHNGGDYGKEAAALLVKQAKELEFLRACRERREPRFVPSRIRLAVAVRGDFPIGHETQAQAGEHDCESNRYGALCVVASNGQRLGIKPGEYEPVAWRENTTRAD